MKLFVDDTQTGPAGNFTFSSIRINQLDGTRPASIPTISKSHINGLPDILSFAKSANRDYLRWLTHQYGLTDRELEIVHWIVLGKTDFEIAIILTKSYFTARNQASKIFKKMGGINRHLLHLKVAEHFYLDKIAPE